MLGHGADHGLGEFDVFEFDSLDVDTPGSRVFFDNREDFGGDFLALGEELVERGFGGDAAHGGLGELEHGIENILDFVDSFARIGHLVIDHSVHFAGDVVFGNGILLGDVDGFGANVDFAERLENGDDNFPTWANDVAESTHGIDDATLIFVDLFKGNKDEKNNNRDEKIHIYLLNDVVGDSITNMRMKLLSLNIEGQKHLDKVREFLRKEKADVVCLQECFGDNIAAIAGQTYSHQLYAPTYLSNQSGGYHDWGEVILSKYPLHYPKINYLLMGRYGPDNLPKAGQDNHVPTMLRTEVQGWQMGTIHFTWTPQGSITQRQRDHMRQLTDLLRGEELVLCGDFNIPRGNEMYGELAQKLKDNIPLSVATTVDPVLHYANKDQIGKLKLVVDYVWSTPKYLVQNVRVVSGVSDHCGVVCEVVLSES